MKSVGSITSIWVTTNVKAMIIVVTIMVGICLPADAKEGGQDGGGGNVCKPQGKPARILDLIGVDIPLDPKLDNPKTARIAYTDNLRQIGVDLAYLSEWGELWILRREIVDGLKNANLEYEAELMTNSFKGIGKALFVDRKSKKSIGADFSQSSECDASNTRAVIYYHSRAGILIDINRWNRLDHFNKLALIVHEALRNVQIRFGGGADNLALQEATALLMTKNYDKIREHRFFDGMKSKANLYRNGEFANLTANLNNGEFIRLLESRHGVRRLSLKQKNEIRARIENQLAEIEAID